VDQLLSSIAGALVSLVFRFVPGLAEWFARQSSVVKRVVMLFCLAVAALAVVVYRLPESGGVIPWGELGMAFFAALTTNQAAYLIIRKPA
jgi:hypothetical protein